MHSTHLHNTKGRNEANRNKYFVLKAVVDCSALDLFVGWASDGCDFFLYTCSRCAVWLQSRSNPICIYTRYEHLSRRVFFGTHKKRCTRRFRNSVKRRLVERLDWVECFLLGNCITVHKHCSSAQYQPNIIIIIERNPSVRSRLCEEKKQQQQKIQFKISALNRHE